MNKVMTRSAFSPLHPFTPSPLHLLAAALAVFSLNLSCRNTPPPGTEELPLGVVRTPGVFVDVGPRWSHDGRWIAFLRRTTDRRFQLCIIPADRSRRVPLQNPEVIDPDRSYTTGRAGYRAPEGFAWSTGDHAIAFSRVEWFTFEDGEKLPGTGLWDCDLKTRHVQALAIHPRKYQGIFYRYRSPQWSPDGKYIAFLAEGLHAETALCVRSLAGTTPVVDVPRFDQYADVDWPAWSPDGRRLVFRQGILRAPGADPLETLRLISPGNSEARRLFATTPARCRQALGTTSSADAIAPRVSGLAWSPDGRRLAFALTPDVLARQRYSVWILDIRPGRAPRRVSPNDGRGYLAPVWIDDATLGALRPSARGTAVDAVALPVDGGEPRLLCTLPGDDLDWSPDRRHIVCAVPPDGMPKPRPAAYTTLRVFETGL